MHGRSELLAYIGSTLITIVGLFGLQQWYVTYLDVHVVHASQLDVPRNPKVEAQRKAETAKLSGGAMPIDQAKAALAQGRRAGFAKIAPKPSDDLSAMSGWMFKPGFKPYAPRTAPAPAVDPNAAPAPATEEGAAPTGAVVAPGDTAAAQAAPAAPAAPAGAGH